MAKETNDVSVNDAARSERIARLISGIKFIDLKIDYSFKRVFGTEGNEDLLLMLVNSILTEKLMYCLRYQDTFTTIPEELRCQELDKMFRISNFAAMDYNEQTEYLQEFLAEIDARSSMRYAREQGLKEGREEGIAEGRAEGRAEGIAEGREEGIAEGRAEVLLETARAMKAEGLSTTIIAKCTGLPIEEIEKL